MTSMVMVKDGEKGDDTEKTDEETTDKVLPEKSCWRKYIGLTLALISSFSFALNAIGCRILVQNYSVFLVAFARTLGVHLPSATFMIYARYVQKKPIFDFIALADKRSIAIIVVNLVGRGFCVAIVAVGISSAIKFIGVGDTLVLKACAPLFVGFLATCLLKESLRLILVICSIQVIVGVVCIAKPSFVTGKEDYNLDSLFGTVLGLSVALASALGIICVRYVRKLHFSIPALAMGVVSSLITGTVCLATGGFAMPDNANGIDALLFVGVASANAFSQILMVIAVKYDTAGLTSLVRTSDVFFGFFLQVVCLGIIPDPLSAIGAIVVVLAVTIAVASKK